MTRLVVVVAATGTLLPALTRSPARAAAFAAECATPSSRPALRVGAPDCLRFRSAALGGVTAIGYYVPPACDPRRSPRPRCPVLYYLHGTGGSYREGVGARGSSGSGWVKALTRGPGVDPRSQPDPWNHADTNAWVPKPALDMIIVSPHGLTVPGGFGPLPDQNAFWFDWNPRYAKGGETPRYDTPAPRFHDHLLRELVPYVDRTFPTGGGREQRAIVGYSMGGIGALANGLRHPDVWSSIGARSGGGFPFGAADSVTVAAPLGGVAPGAPYTRVPGIVPTLAPEAAWQVLYGTVATVGFGDFVADNPWWRQTQPAELVGNARARAADRSQSVHLQYFVNDAVPRRVEDLSADPSGVYFEAILMPTNLFLEQRFAAAGVKRTFHLGPGLHSGVYALPYFREQLEGQYARLRHRDGSGRPLPAPAVFDYRTLVPDFTIWGWRFRTQRPAVEFLYLSDVSCRRVTLRGSGVVTVTVPEACRTGRNRAATFTVDLGAAQTTDEPATGAAGGNAYGHTVTVELSPL